MKPFFPLGKGLCWVILLVLLIVDQLALAEDIRVPSAGACEILNVEGSVEYYSHITNTWRTATSGVTIEIGDRLRTGPNSRATVRFSDFSILRVNQATTFRLEPPPQLNKKPLLDLNSGSLYFYSREKPAQIQFRTPTSSGAIRGTEFALLTLADNTTVLSLLDGEVDIGNDLGVVVLRSGEEARVSPGQPPSRTAVASAINVIQWCLYYPAVVSAADIDFSNQEREILQKSLDVYTSGDLLEALAMWPKQQIAMSDAVQRFHAAVLIGVGRVDAVEAILPEIDQSSSLDRAIHEMVAAVQGRTWTRSRPPESSSEWLAESYYLQSKGELEQALAAADAAVKGAPQFGFAWARKAELEFALERLPQARRSLNVALQFSPRNPQAIVVKGFLLLAENRVKEAQACFDSAIALDGALANAWLGRSFCRFRSGKPEEGRMDLLVAAAVEPQRSVLRSYLAKAFDQTGNTGLAEKELRLAKQLDSRDPTPWLYGALMHAQQNRINEAVEELEKSRQLNDNQRLFRSRFQLDQDVAVREVNLAKLYADIGMSDLAVREAASSVDYDYANYSAHLFLSDSYAQRIDANKYDLRYSSAVMSEWLIANLLAPSGGAATLSRSVASRDYLPLFETDRPGFSASTEYYSRGAFSASGSQFGRADKLDYAVDAFYHSDRGQRPNDQTEENEFSAQTKVQATDRDSFFLFAQHDEVRGGDVAQYPDFNNYRPGLRVSRDEGPDVSIGYHREWEPGVHTLVLASRIDSDLTLNAPKSTPPFFYYRDGVINWANAPYLPLRERQEMSETSYAGEIQQIWQGHSQSLIIGTRFQAADYHMTSDLAPMIGADIPQDFETGSSRESVYAYHYWQVLDSLRLTLGATYDYMEFPANILTVPFSESRSYKGQLSPKVGFVYRPRQNTTLRAHYTQSLSAVNNENDLRLEPAVVGGFNQSFRHVFPEPLVGMVPGSAFETWACGVDHVFQSRTYLGLEGEIIKSDADRIMGALTNSMYVRVADCPSSIQQDLSLQENSLLLTLGQLLGKEWAAGVRYSLSDVELDGRFPSVPPTAINASKLIWDESSVLHQLSLFANFNHSSGAFAQMQSTWYYQTFSGNSSSPGDSDFWQHDAFVGYRLFRRRVEIGVGILNLFDRDYHLNPLNAYSAVPRERTFVARCRIAF